MRQHKSLIQIGWELREAVAAMIEHPECPVSVFNQLSTLSEKFNCPAAIHGSSRLQNTNGKVEGDKAAIATYRGDLDTFAEIVSLNNERITELISLALKPEIKADALYTYHEVATLAGVSYMTIFRAAEAGYLKADYIGSEPRIRGAAVLQWLEEGGKTGRSKKNLIEESRMS